MLAECENGLIDLVRNAPIGKRLATVGSMPHIDGTNLVSRFGAEAPAVYVAPGRIETDESNWVLNYVLACTARNARGERAVRQGDARTVGLYQVIEAVLGEVHGGLAGGVRWYVEGVEYLRDELLAKNGIYVALVQVQSPPVAPAGIDESALADFLVFDAQYDVEPHEPRAKSAGY